MTRVSTVVIFVCREKTCLVGLTAENEFSYTGNSELNQTGDDVGGIPRLCGSEQLNVCSNFFLALRCGASPMLVDPS